MNDAMEDMKFIDLGNEVLDPSIIYPRKRFLVQTMTRNIWADQCYGSQGPSTYCILGNTGIDGMMIFTKVIGAEIVVHDFGFVTEDGKKDYIS